ncbi:MAG: hypothetical protein ABJP48_12205 [Erythrobacter sp.]
MSEASFASLNPALLARKGGAKPAMRPQLTNLPDAETPENLEDLGWNDMGQEDAQGEEQHSAEVVQLTPAEPRDVDGQDFEPNDEPPVVLEQKKLAQRLTSKPKKSAKSNAKRQSAASQGRRAAFTLRLDADRHLKLKLAATMQDKSAQALVTEALDEMLDQIEDLNSLVKQMKRD